MPANVAIIDHEGVILVVNQGWRNFAAQNGGAEGCAPGANYLEVARRACGPFSEEATAVHDGLESCLRGTHSHFTLEYPCHSPAQRRWFRLQASRLSPEGTARVMVMHFDISDTRLAQEKAMGKDSHLQLALEAGQVGSWNWDIATGQSYWNPQEYQLLGLSPREGCVPVELFLDHVHPEDREGLDQELQRVLAGGDEFRRHFRIIRADGAIRWLAGRGRLIRDPATGQALQMLGVNFDVTDSKESEQKIRDSEARWRLLVEGVDGVALLMLDPEGRLTSWNPGAQRVFGYAAEEALGRHISSFYPSKDVDKADHELRLALQGECIQHRGWRLTRGGPAWMECTTTALKDDKGVLRGFARLVRDISEQARSEEALHSVVTHSVDAIVTIDVKGIICSCKGAFARLFGYDVNELVGRNVSELMPDPWRSAHDGYLKDYQARKSPRVIGRLREVVGLRKDGSTFPLELTVTEFCLDDEVFYIGVMRDLTERKKLEAQFFQAQKMEAIGVLAGGIAHDFNNLLTVINGCSELILEEVDETNPLRELLVDIYQAGEKGAALTGQLLTFSRQQEIVPVIVNLNKVVNDLEKLLGRVIGADIHLRTELSPDVLPVMCDPHQIEQILMNLVVNARDALTSGGQIDITTGLYRRDKATPPGLGAGPYVALSVRDNGCGMSPELQERVFEPFFTTKGPGKGTGLGLSTVYGIAKRSKGFILVDSAVGQGTTFTLILPASQGGQAACAGSASWTSGQGCNQTILVVEDDKAVLGLATHILQLEGYRVLSACCAREALAIADSNQGAIHLLLTDVVMPDMRGPELAKQIRTRLPQVKVLLMSGYAEETIPRGFASGFIHKPFSRTGLSKQVWEALQN